MTLIAVSTINFGKDDGSVKTFKIGDTVSGLNEDQERSLIESGSVVETGDRKYTEAPKDVRGDEETRKRDEILAKAAMGENLSPAVLAAIASNSSNAAAERAESLTPETAPTIGAVASNPEGAAADEKAAAKASAEAKK